MTDNELAARAIALALYTAELQVWYGLPFVKRLLTPKPKLQLP